MKEPLDEQVFFSRLKNNIELYTSSATQILRDLEAARFGRPAALYNRDYSLAAGMLRSARRARDDELHRPKGLHFIGAAVFALYPQYIGICGLTLAISPPTVLELLRALLHKADEYALVPQARI